MVRALALFLCLAAIGCSADSDEDGGGGVAPLEPHVTVNGVPTDFENAEVLLCRDELPGVVDFVMMRRGTDCPEQTTIGGSGDPVSRGRICEEIRVRLVDPEVGQPVTTAGTTSALLTYSRYMDPPLSISTGDTGPSSERPQGSVTLHTFHEQDDTYRVRFELRLEGDDLIEASGGFSIEPRFCTSA